MKCDFCDQPGVSLVGESNELIACADHAAGGWVCQHEWLDRPESDTRECLICGVER
jgi:hypothetical protein